ncbi:MAG: TIGR03560 family F420-dependent LLM class oxidoreductase [Candidatus Heimdallarchaeota archaeon]|nr:TIGR03560 family F420-dependent LLM class oxidoreductase [Candidatus Heimdallarchaeota archaeon]MCK4955478.1 TIGR03560 family F420-dependent LLM class oxidoreductase [Candidatus Heimdallarchaeota archaeon]
MKIKFGVFNEPSLGYDYSTLEQYALEAEKYEYDSYWISDHLLFFRKFPLRNCLDSWTVLAALAKVTNNIKLGTLVTCNSFRYPSILAKQAATIDMISNGRLFFGYGAGWNNEEYEAYGFPYPSSKERLEQMEEAIQLIKLLWTEEKINFSGKYYNLKDCVFAPKPIQKPTPPILIGGDGPKITLKLVAKYADYCNLFHNKNLEWKIEALKQHCKDVGRDYEGLGKSLFAGWPGIVFTESEEEKEQFYRRRSEYIGIDYRTVKSWYELEAPGSWIGFPEEIRERFGYLLSLGLEYFQVQFHPADNLQEKKMLDSVRIFKEKVANKL